MVLAMGALMDLELPAHSPEAMQYYQLAKAALSINSVFEEQSIPGIQALVSSLFIHHASILIKHETVHHVSFHVLE